MTTRIKVRRGLEQHEVRLRLGVIVESDRILHGYHPTSACEFDKQLVEAVDRAAMEWTDGWHINDLSVEQFDPGVRLEHAGFRYAIVILYAEAMFCLNLHERKITNHFGIC